MTEPLRPVVPAALLSLPGVDAGEVCVDGWCGPADQLPGEPVAPTDADVTPDPAAAASSATTG